MKSSTRSLNPLKKPVYLLDLILTIGVRSKRFYGAFSIDIEAFPYLKMAHLNTVAKCAGAPRWSHVCKAAAARPTGKAPVNASNPVPYDRHTSATRFSQADLSAVTALTCSRTFASQGSPQKDDVPRAATGEVQKQNNFASEVGKKMQEVAPGGGPADSAKSGSGEQPKQERDKGGSK